MKQKKDIICIICSTPLMGVLQKRVNALVNEINAHPPILRPSAYLGDSPIKKENAFVLIWELKEERQETIILDYILRYLYKAIINVTGETRSYICLDCEKTATTAPFFQVSELCFLPNSISFYHEFHQTLDDYVTSARLNRVTIKKTSRTIAIDYIKRCRFLLSICEEYKNNIIETELLSELSLLSRVKNIEDEFFCQELEKLQYDIVCFAQKWNRKDILWMLDKLK